MTLSSLIFVIFSTICSVTGQLTLKKGMNKISGDSGGLLLQRMAFSPWVIGGLAVYGTGVLFWLMALSRLEVSYLYPFAALGYAGITLGSSLLFHEPISRTRLAGIALIIIGVMIAGSNIQF